MKDRDRRSGEEENYVRGKVRARKYEDKKHSMRLRYSTFKDVKMIM